MEPNKQLDHWRALWDRALKDPKIGFALDLRYARAEDLSHYYRNADKKREWYIRTTDMDEAVEGLTDRFLPYSGVPDLLGGAIFRVTVERVPE